AAIIAIAFVLGFERSELRALWRRFLIGLITAYDTAMRLAGRGARASAGIARRARDKQATAPRTPAKTARAPILTRRQPGSEAGHRDLDAELPEPELIERDADYDGDAPSADEVSGRISDAIRSRSAKSSVLAAVARRLVREGAVPDAAGDPPAPADAADPAPFGESHARKLTPPRKPVPASRQARAEAEPQLSFDDNPDAYERPPLSLLTAPSTIERLQLSDEAMMENARMLEAVLDDYGVKGQITEVRPGPVVTLYELEPAPGLKASRVIGLADDIARSMSALSARVSTVPGRTVIGIELPNARREKVILREILASRAFGDGTQPLPLALGKDIGGDPIVVVLTESVPDSHLDGLRGEGVSYIFAGTSEIDLALTLDILARELGVKRLLVEGGGIANGVRTCRWQGG
ncbi:MAG: DNA translocase FtsK, partial [Paracoccus sp. (in: a-proteobacteria)]